MSFAYKLLSSLLVAGLALTLSPSLQVSAEGEVNTPISTPTYSSPQKSRSVLPQNVLDTGWGKEEKNNVSTAKNTTKLQSTSLQAVAPSYVCSANYFATQSSPSTVSLAADGVGNTYTSGYNYSTDQSKFSRINSSGVETAITISSNLYTDNIVANASGDAFQLNYNLSNNNYEVYKVPNGTSNYNLIYSASSFTKGVYSEGLKIDDAGNLYIFYIVSTGDIKIDKISGTGSVLNTFTLPKNTNYGSDHEYSIYSAVISNSGLIYIPLVKKYSSTPSNNHYIVILNADGTKKADFQYSSNSSVNVLLGITDVPNGVSGGGVYITYGNTSRNVNVKRISDTDSYPFSTTPTFTYTETIGDMIEHKVIVESNNSYIYIYNHNDFKRFKISDASMQYVMPVGSLNGYDLQIVRNSSNQFVFTNYSISDLFKLNCATPYTDTVITSSNISSENPYCVQNTTGTAEQNSYYCSFLLVKGLTFTLPTEARAQIAGSGNSTTNAYVFDNILVFPSIPMGSINTTAARNVQVSINGGTYNTVTSVISYQPFGVWSANPITIASKTEEIIYNSKMYQVAFGTDSGLYLRSMDTNNVFGNWQRLGAITAKSTPTLSVDPNGDLYVFAQGTDNGLYFWKVGEAGGEKWRRFGWITIKDRVSVHNFNGKYWLYATGTDNGNYVAKFSTFSPTNYVNPTWNKAGNITVNVTVQGGVANSKLYQIAIGTDFGLYYRTTDTSEVWGSWTRVDSTTYTEISKPAIVGSKLAISVKKKDSPYSFYTTDFGSSYPYLVQSLNSNRSATFGVFANQFTEVGMGIDNKLYHRNHNPSTNISAHSNWIQGNNITISDTPSQFSFNGKQYQFARGTDNKLWTRSRN